MAMLGGSWSDNENYDREMYNEGFNDSKQETRLHMITLLMSILKCRKDHATDLVDNHLKKNSNGNMSVLPRNGLHKSMHGRKNQTKK